MPHFLSTNAISPLLLQYGYIGYFLVSVVEGPIVSVIAGSLTALGYFNFFLLYVLALLGDAVGDLLFYAVGRWGNTWFLRRGRFGPVKVAQVEKMREHFELHSGKTLLFGKWAHAFGAPILIAAGMARMPLIKFLWINVVGTIPKAFFFLIIGYYFGRAYQEIDRYFGRTALIVSISVVAIIVLYYVWKRRNQSRI